ncbi:MAG TPA: DUF2332 domain-containing protein, partial [Thermoleophilaceae bacterium]|nr:DUF2332 domain-containing protein [Thermoleophilaceae bacterium]
GRGEPDETWPAFLATVAEHRDELRELVHNPVQTNEVGRARALACGLLLLARETGMPLRLLELGSSAGLNLRWDSFGYRSGSFSFGDPNSPVGFRDFLEGDPPPAPPERVEIAGRAGCDPRPVDVNDPDGVLTLRSYVWPDQLERLHLLDAALALAVTVPVELEAAGAADWLERRLGASVPGACTVVFHSIVMQYVDDAERGRINRVIAAAGARASEAAPLAHLALEPGGEHAELRLTRWPGGHERLLARCGYHGSPVRWTASPDQ